MKRIVEQGIIVAVAATLLGAAVFGPNMWAVHKAKQAAAQELLDPSSAQFRNVRVVSDVGSKTVCGEVNGKNRYGAYAGYRRFVASGSIATIDPDRTASADVVGWWIHRSEPCRKSPK